MIYLRKKTTCFAGGDFLKGFAFKNSNIEAQPKPFEEEIFKAPMGLHKATTFGGGGLLTKMRLKAWHEIIPMKRSIIYITFFNQ
jgi:hypothetical protein